MPPIPASRSALCAASRTALPVAVAAVTLTGTAWAIPSPDVMVNLFASSAQVLGLVSVILGRWLWVRRKRGSAGSAGDARGWRAAFLVTAGLCALCAVGWGLYGARVADERNERLQVNLNRNSREEGRKIVDVSLRELPFSQQLERPDGVQTADLADRLAARQGPQLLDVREDEEFEVGAIEGARHARYPDVLADPERFVDKGRLVLLLCFNGNRSSELAEALRGRGYETAFLVGGYEKWMAEERPIARSIEGEQRDLREIPEYPNKDVLLDTRDVVRLLEARDVLFVDVRYPGDFETLGHLPGAVNVPFRKLTTPELDAALRALPHKPIVVPCYDKRSSFFAWVLGLRLTRMGYEFLGRYTTPESFTVSGQDKPHVAAWKAAQQQRTLLSVVSKPLVGALDALRGASGSLWAAILILVLLVRLAILPLTAKAERDRRTEAGLKAELGALKARFADDPAARSQATLALLARHGVRPFWNLASSAAQLVLFTLFFGAVAQVARGSTQPFAWIPELGRPDPARALPIACALLMGLVVWSTAAKRSWKRALGALATAGVLLALVLPLTAATQLYLAANLLLLDVHNAAVGRWMAWRAGAGERARRRVLRRWADAPVVPLRHAHVVPGCGAKAARLGQLIEAGLPVPDGFVVRERALDLGRVGPEAQATILAAHAELGAARVAVRSSGLNEDGAEKSYAGVFESILDVERDGLLAAVEEVARSWSGARVESYSQGVEETGAIVVQAMVPAAWAGVLFTEHPGESGAAAVELVDGLGDALVSGRKQPHGYRLGRLTGRQLDGGKPPIDLAPLFALGRRVEALFGVPQDVEWAFADGRYLLLQARDITRLARTGQDERARREHERARLLELLREAPEERALAQNELSELLPRPTPLSLSLMRSLWDHGGTTQAACRALGVPYDVRPDSPSLCQTAFGQLYVDRREERRRARRAPGALACFRLARAADRMEESWREEHLPRALRAARRDAAFDLARLSLVDLVELFRERRERFVHEDYARAEEINVAADVYLKTAVRELERRGLDPATHLSHLPTTVVQEAHALLSGIARGTATAEAFLEHSGHRAPHDWELATPRYDEDPALVATLAARAGAAPPDGGAQRRAAQPATPEGGVLGLAVDRALRWQALKEEAKHHALRDLAFLRRVVVELGRRTGLDERVFLLTWPEVERLADAGFREHELAALVEEREDERAAFEAVRLASELAAADLERLDLCAPGALPRPHASGALHGTRVSGDAGVIGRARVLRDAAEIDTFRDGEILVARFTDPTWMPLFPRARAIVTEVGGWLSHAAIQAREHGLPAVVGARGALDAIETGDLLRLAPDGAIERVPERRVEERRPVAIEVVVVRGAHARVRGRVTDVSSTGARLRIQEDRLELGEELALEALDGGVVRATVVRNGVPGVYGVHIATPFEEAAVALAS